MKGTKNKFLVKTTISTAWRLFDWLNYNEIDNAECHCVDLKQGQIFLDSFEYFFHNNMTINLLQAKDKSEYFLGHDEHPRPTCDRKYIPNKKDTVTYSFARHYFELFALVLAVQRCILVEVAEFHTLSFGSLSRQLQSTL